MDRIKAVESFFSSISEVIKDSAKKEQEIIKKLDEYIKSQQEKADAGNDKNYYCCYKLNQLKKEIIQILGIEEKGKDNEEKTDY